jgi:hypothetical protein
VAESDDDLAQGSVVEVHRPPPCDPARVEIERIAPIELIVEERREQVVRRTNRMEIAGEMEIDLLHRHDLGIAATRGAALGAEARA